MECNPETNECNSECCRILTVYKGKITRELKHYYLTRGCTIDKDVVLVRSVCPQLDEDNKCKLHNKGKPYLCKIYHGQKKGYYAPKKCVFR